MSYGQLRLLYENFITAASMITPESQAIGMIGGVEKTSGTGSATMYPSGTYTGTTDTQYIVQIDDISAGVSVGQATFKWKTSADSSWTATGVATASTATSLSNGVSVAFNTGDGDDFALGDTFRFEVTAIYGKEKLIDLDRNAVFRSGATKDIVIDLGSAQTVTTFVLLDHNLTTANTTLKLQANSSDSWGAPPYDYTISTITDPLILYLSQEYRYWRIDITDAVISYAEIGELYLGDYAELDVKQSRWGTPRGYGYTIIENTSQSGVMRRKVYGKQTRLKLDFPQVLTNDDIAILVDMQEALMDLTTGRVDPFFLHLFYDETDTVFFGDWKNIHEFERVYESPLLNSGSIEFSEQVNTR